MKISRILHAGYLLESGGKKILFDPIFENPFSHNCFAYPDIEFDLTAIRELKVDAVFISHYHDDHCSLESLDLLERDTLIYIYCVYPEMTSLLRELGFSKVMSLNLNEQVGVGGFQVTAMLALDPEVDAVFHIQCGGLNILNAVDAWLDPGTVEKLSEQQWDLVLWPFQTMREIEVLAPALAEPADHHPPPELLQQLQQLKPRVVVPGSCQFIQESWSWYREAFFPISYKQFAADVKAVLPATAVVRLDPGESSVLAASGLQKNGRLSWVRPRGNQEVDYTYNASVKPPSTAEVARHFPVVDSAAVLDYCRGILPEKFARLERSEEMYFQRSLSWKLVLYDHEGREVSFFYRLAGAEMTLTDEQQGAPDWQTEVPLFKLHAAIFSGETLSSMYVRINEGLDRELLRNVDIMQDPLIRALFSKEFAGFQKAQLRKLKAAR